jgi:2-dehydro-3-deoxyphosphogluconate aldolase/(4S)-4-hydroxy-2-oxoglutarate aldolase
VSSDLDTGRDSAVAGAIRAARLIVVLRRVEPRARLLDLVGELADAGARIFEITFDGADAAADLDAARSRFGTSSTGGDRDPRSGLWFGAGTVRTLDQLRSAVAADAAFGVSPVLDPVIVGEARSLGLPFIPGAYTPTEADLAWRAGATFVKLFPASSLGTTHVRELRGPMPEIEVMVTGGVDATNAGAFLAAGATAVGVGSAIVRASPAERRALIAAVAAAAPG